MKKLINSIFILIILFTAISCKNNDDETNSVANNVTLEFRNTFKDEIIVLGGANSSLATINTSVEGQIHHFSELKYVVSNIRLIKTDGTEIPYNVNDLDKGAIVINQSKPSSLSYILSTIPSGDYKQIKFGLGIRADLNTLDQVRFPKFYEAAGKNDTAMHWEWGTGYRFTKIEGFYGTDNKQFSIHTGSTVSGTNGEPSTYIQGVNAYREIALNLTTHAIVGRISPKIIIKADFDKLLSGKTTTIILGNGNVTPSVHTAANMVKFVDNLGGNGTSDLTGMFSIVNVEN